VAGRQAPSVRRAGHDAVVAVRSRGADVLTKSVSTRPSRASTRHRRHQRARPTRGDLSCSRPPRGTSAAERRAGTPRAPLHRRRGSHRGTRTGCSAQEQISSGSVPSRSSGPRFLSSPGWWSSGCVRAGRHRASARPAGRGLRRRRRPRGARRGSALRTGPIRRAGPQDPSTWRGGRYLPGEVVRLILSWRGGLFGVEAAGEMLLPGPDARLAPDVRRLAAAQGAAATRRGRNDP
jgi:hypothetical protein